MKETQQIDMLFLELSQFTKAKTATEIKLRGQLEVVKAHLDAGRIEDAMFAVDKFTAHTGL